MFNIFKNHINQPSVSVEMVSTVAPTLDNINSSCIKNKGQGFKEAFILFRDASIEKDRNKKLADYKRRISAFPQGITAEYIFLNKNEKEEIKNKLAYATCCNLVLLTVNSEYSMSVYQGYCDRIVNEERKAGKFKTMVETRHPDVLGKIVDILTPTMRNYLSIRNGIDNYENSFVFDVLYSYIGRVSGDGYIYVRFSELGMEKLTSLDQCHGMALAILDRLSSCSEFAQKYLVDSSCSRNNDLFHGDYVHAKFIIKKNHVPLQSW